VKEARAAGASLWILGDDQVGFRFAVAPSPGLLARLRANKSEVLAALRAERWRVPRSSPEADLSGVVSPPESLAVRAAGSDQPSALERMAERFRIRAGYAKAAAWEPGDAKAYVTAFHDLVSEWRDRRPPAPAGAPDGCARCGEHACNAHGAADGGSVWLCRNCWRPFDAERDATARAAIIKAMRAAQARGLLDDVDIAALEAAPRRTTATIGETFDADLHRGGR
jgi:hypothetical protein